MKTRVCALALLSLFFLGCGAPLPSFRLYVTSESPEAQLSTAVAKFFLDKVFRRQVTVQSGCPKTAQKAFEANAADALTYCSLDTSATDSPIENLGKLVDTRDGHKFIRKALKLESPDIYDFFAKMKLSDHLKIADAVAWKNSQKEATFDDAAVKFLDATRSSWMQWIPESLHNSMQEAIRAEIQYMEINGFTDL